MPPAHLLLTSLPVELLHNIFSGLDTLSVVSARLTCCLLAHIGLDHFGDEIPLVFHRNKFRALTEIATHPVLAKRMRSLYYACDLLKRTDWYQWDVRRSSKEVYCDSVMDFRTESEQRSRVLTMKPRDGIKRLKASTKSDTAAFKRFNEMCTDQASITEHHYVISCLRTMFEGCPKLRGVTVAFRSDDGGPQRRLKSARTAFAEAMTVAHGDPYTLRTGTEHMSNLAQALQQSGKSLDSLTLVNVGYSVLNDMCGSWTDKEAVRKGVYDAVNLTPLVRPLRRLRVFIQTTHREPAMNFTTDIPETSIFTEALELRVLSIHLPDRLPDHQRPREEQPDPVCIYEILKQGMQINNILTRTKLPHLYALSLANCRVCGETLIDLVARHWPTLRRLSLQNISLTVCKDSCYYSHAARALRTWPEVFTYLAGRLPQLHDVRLRGFLFESRQLAMRWYAPETPEGAKTSSMFCPARDAVETFILTGEKPPWGQYDFLSPSWEPKKEGYVPPGLSDNDRLDDDPAREYEVDEFDLL